VFFSGLFRNFIVLFKDGLTKVFSLLEGIFDRADYKVTFDESCRKTLNRYE